MAKKVEVKLNLKGINEMMKSEGVRSALQRAGEAVAKAAGDGYAASTDTIRWVGVTNVYPTTQASYWRNIRENTLLKAVGSVGLPTTKTKIDVSGW